MPICQQFQNHVVKLVKRLTGVKDDHALTDLSANLIHDRAGLSIPDYPKVHRDLYVSSVRFSHDNARHPKRAPVPMVSYRRDSPTLDAPKTRFRRPRLLQHQLE